MSQIRFSKDHEWVRVEGDTATIGITDFAQTQLGDVVFVDLPEIGRVVAQGGECAVVESVKAASEVYAPVAGTIIAANDALADSPNLVNEDPLGAGWFVKLTISNPGELDGLMDEGAYAAYVGELG